MSILHHDAGGLWYDRARAQVGLEFSLERDLGG